MGRVFATLLVLLTGCSHPVAHHWLRIADGAGDLPSLNPHLTMSATMDDVGRLALAYFMRYDRAGPGRQS